MELDLGSKDIVHIQLAGVNHRVFCPTQRKIEGHTGGISGAQKDVQAFLMTEGGEENSFLHYFMGLSGLFPNI